MKSMAYLIDMARRSLWALENAHSSVRALKCQTERCELADAAARASKLLEATAASIEALRSLIARMKEDHRC